MKENIKIINLFFLISALTAIFLSINIIIQYCFNVDLFGNTPPAAEYGRYSSLFGDWLVGGGFLTRIMFLGVIYILFIFNLKKNMSSIIFSYLVIITFGIFLSGERTSFFMLIINIMLFSFYLKSFREMALKFFICFIFLFLFFTNINPVVEKRMFEATKNQILENNKINMFSKIHQSHYVVAFNMFKDRPFLGHGVKSFREACREERYIHYNGCATHPHNFYIQFLAEMGLLGFGFLLLFYLYIIYQFTKNLLKKNKNNIDLVKLILYQTLIVNLFPLMPNGNFFNNWLNVVMYIPLALIIFFETLTKKDETYLIKKFK
jgi:O-antigen ligase